MRTKIKKHMTRLLVAALAIVFAVGFAPQMSAPAYADDGDPAIMAGSDILAKSANKDGAQIVSFGGRDWYVIAYDGKDGDGNEITYDNPDGNTVPIHPDGAIALFQQGINESSQFHEDNHAHYHYAYGYVDDESTAPSTLRRTVENTYLSGENALISAAEQAAIVPRTLSGGCQPIYDAARTGWDANTMAGHTLENALVWPLSVAEAQALPGSIRGQGDAWLRTPGSHPYTTFEFINATMIRGNGDVDIGGESVLDGKGVRPAFYLDKKSVLFTAAAYSGKASGKPGINGLKKVGDNTDNDWTVTLKDNVHKNFKVESVAAENCWAPKISYSGAATGTNEYISAIIVDKDGDITYYGRIKKCANDADAAGEAAINVKGKIGPDDKLYVFNEQYNGDAMTDFASALVQVDKGPYPMDEGHQLSKTDGREPSCTEPGNKEYWTCTVCGQYFGDEQCTQKIKKDSWILKALGHDLYPRISRKATIDCDGEISQLCHRCHWEISKVPIPHPNSFNLSPAAGEYTGKPIEPIVTVKGNDGKTIAAENYLIKYSNNIEIGNQATAKVTFQGDYYEGEKELTFSIKPVKVALPKAKKLTYTGKQQTGVETGADYSIIGNKAAKAGTYTATLRLKDPSHYAWSDGSTANKSVKFTIKKAANTLKVKGKTAAVKYSALKKKNQSLGVTKVVAFKNKGQGAKTYIKAAGNKNITIAKKTGKVTVKKGLKKGTYKVTVKVKAAGSTNYNASAVKKVAFKISVK